MRKLINGDMGETGDMWKGVGIIQQGNIIWCVAIRETEKEHVTRQETKRELMRRIQEARTDIKWVRGTYAFKV